MFLNEKYCRLLANLQKLASSVSLLWQRLMLKIEYSVLLFSFVLLLSLGDLLLFQKSQRKLQPFLLYLRVTKRLKESALSKSWHTQRKILWQIGVWTAQLLCFFITSHSLKRIIFLKSLLKVLENQNFHTHVSRYVFPKSRDLYVMRENNPETFPIA